MAPIAHTARSLAASAASNTFSDTTHPLRETPFRQLSLWAYISFVVIFLSITAVVGYVVYSCYRSSAVDIEAVEAPAQGVGGYTEARLSPRANGRMKKNKVQLDRTKRRGIVTFSDKAKFLVCSKDLGATNPFVIDVRGQQKLQVKPPRRVVTNANVSMTSNSSTEYDGDSYALDSPTVATPPQAYFHHSHRGSPVKMTNINDPKIHKTPTTPAMTSLASMTPPVTSPLAPVIRIRTSDIKYDLHNIRFVLPRERSMESLETARLWKDPKLSPVGGNIIHPHPVPLSPVGIPVGNHMSLSLPPGKDPKKNKGAFQTGVGLNIIKGTKGRR